MNCVLNISSFQIVADKVKDEHYLVKKAVNYFLTVKGERIYIQKSVREILFDGYDDPLIDIALKLNMSSLNLPFTKFGWFVDVSLHKFSINTIIYRLFFIEK